MLEIAKPETRSVARTHPEKFTWGVVDIILALVMLPFGLWTLLIEAIVNFAAGLADFDAHASRLAAFRSEEPQAG